MSFSISHGRVLEVGNIGIAQEDLPHYGAGPIDLRAWFGPELSDRPLELEIGSGKGTFLIQEAAIRQGTNFIGVEWAKAYWRYAADRCRRQGLNNVRLVRIEADMFLRNYVSDCHFRAVHLYFPDPWPKKRHHKRRLVQEAFLRQLHRVIEDDGQVLITTDHRDYFHWMIDHVDRLETSFRRCVFTRPESAGDGEVVGTNFERKYRLEGREFYGMRLVKIPIDA